MYTLEDWLQDTIEVYQLQVVLHPDHTNSVAQKLESVDIQTTVFGQMYSLTKLRMENVCERGVLEGTLRERDVATNQLMLQGPERDHVAQLVREKGVETRGLTLQMYSCLPPYACG